MTGSMHDIIVRTIGIKRVEFNIGLTNFKASVYYEKEDRETVMRGIQKLSEMLNGVVF